MLTCQRTDFTVWLLSRHQAPKRRFPKPRVFARRAHALRISAPVPVARLVERVAAAPLALVAAAGGPPVRRVLEGFEASGALAAAGAPDAQPALLLVGPEGDFTPEELAALAAAGGTLAGLGERRLRVETAAVALLAAATLFIEP